MSDLFEYKEIIYGLAMRDLKLRYQKPFLGFLWMLIMPFSMAVIYKILFSDFMRVNSGSYPFFIHLITALLPWNYFISSVQGANRCILDNKTLFNQASFPKRLLPVSVVLANLLNFLPSLLVLLIFLAAFHVKISILLFFLPAIILIQTSLALGLAFLVSALQVIYRDTEYITQVIFSVLFFLTPGVYVLEEVISRAHPFWVNLYMFNPLVGILNLYRIIFIGDYLKGAPHEINFLNTVVSPILCSSALLFIGYFVFKKLESRFFEYLNV